MRPPPAPSRSRRSGAVATAVASAVVGAVLLGAGCAGDGAAERTTDEPAAPPTSPATASTTAPAASSPGHGAPVDTATPVTGEVDAEQRFPDVVDVEATFADGAWTFAVTVSSPYDTPERYADAWRVVGPDGTVYGERILAHDHAGEQPFTRSQSGIVIPDDVERVLVEARDLQYGWGGGVIGYELPPRDG